MGSDTCIAVAAADHQREPVTSFMVAGAVIAATDETQSSELADMGENNIQSKADHEDTNAFGDEQFPTMLKPKCQMMDEELCSRSAATELKRDCSKVLDGLMAVATNQENSVEKKAETSERHKIQVEMNRFMDIITSVLCPHTQVFLRELVSITAGVLVNASIQKENVKLDGRLDRDASAAWAASESPCPEVAAAAAGQEVVESDFTKGLVEMTSAAEDAQATDRLKAEIAQMHVVVNGMKMNHDEVCAKRAVKKKRRNCRRRRSRMAEATLLPAGCGGHGSKIEKREVMTNDITERQEDVLREPLSQYQRGSVRDGYARVGEADVERGHEKEHDCVMCGGRPACDAWRGASGASRVGDALPPTRGARCWPSRGSPVTRRGRARVCDAPEEEVCEDGRRRWRQRGARLCE